MDNKCFLNNECNHIDCDKDFCMKKYKLNYLYDEALVSENQRVSIGLMLDNDNADYLPYYQLAQLRSNIVNFVDSGENLYIHSTIAGNGKTSWALKLLQTYFNNIWYKTSLKCRALFINVPTFLIALKTNINNPSEYINHINENILSCDLVIWDDIGTKVATIFEHENLLSLIDQRINLSKSNIFTSNLNEVEMHETLGDRLASRICNLGYDIEFTGKDKRGINHARIN